MRLRVGRRSRVTWRLSVGPADRYEALGFTRLARTKRIRRCVRLAVLLTVIGLMGLARRVRSRWPPLSAAALLTVFGVLSGNGASGLFLAAGLLFVYPLLIPARSDADRMRRYELERETPVYSIPADCHQIVWPP